MNQKLERANFNIARGKLLSEPGLKYLERCKEERLWRERDDSKKEGKNCDGGLVGLLAPLVPLEQIFNRGVFLGFVGYLLASQCRAAIERVVRERNSGALVELKSPITSAELLSSTSALNIKLCQRIRSILLASGKVELFHLSEGRTDGFQGLQRGIRRLPRCSLGR